MHNGAETLVVPLILDPCNEVEASQCGRKAPESLNLLLFPRYESDNPVSGLIFVSTRRLYRRA